MAIIKCKMCGGDIVLSEDRSFGTCEYCGSTMTFPKVSDEQKLNLFNRANHFRRQNEFDKAIAAYDKILDQDDADAEAHWGAVLSRYGIEYVEDPVTHERIPTCHRVQPTSILTDPDYLAALEHAPDGESRGIYEQEAHHIADIQKGILAISSQEKPYDVFICYKESDDSGSRTVDSTLAQEIYYQLTNEGYKVFFSRITLEDKLGQQYEPYIFAALNSAKVMLVIGTKPEYFNAVWVKNEWSRFLALMKNDRSKLLIPCYRGMDPYDLPEELSTLQSQDMAKIGFIQDITRGIKKVLDDGKQKQAPAQPEAVVSAAPGVESLLTRAQLFLEDGDWESAREYADRILDIDPKFAAAYIVKVQVARKASREEQLSQGTKLLTENSDFQKALRFANARQKAVYEGYNKVIAERIEQARIKGIFDGACTTAANARSEWDFTEAAKAFESIPGYLDADQRAEKCRAQAAEAARRAEEQRQREEQERYERERKAREEKLEAERRAEQARIEEEERRKRARKLVTITAAVMAVVLTFVLVNEKVIKPGNAYKGANALLESGQYDEAFDAFTALGTYKDSDSQALESQYQKGLALMASKAYDDATAAFNAAGDYKDAAAQALESQYQKGLALMAESKYDEASEAFVAIKSYNDAQTQAYESQYQKGLALLEAKQYDDATTQFLDVVDIVSGMAPEPHEESEEAAEYAVEVAVEAAEAVSDASEPSEGTQTKPAPKRLSLDTPDTLYDETLLRKGYRDSLDKAMESRYKKGEALLVEKDYQGAAEAFNSILSYGDAASRLKQAEADYYYEQGFYAEATGIYATLDEVYQTHSDELAQKYADAQKLLEQGDYDGATAAFSAISGYSDAETQAKESQYQKGTALLANGDYDGAYAVFAALTGYKDVDSIIENDDNIAAAATAAWRAQFSVGNTVEWGRYEQDDNASNGVEAVEWIVLANDGDTATMISKYGLDAKPYNTERTSVTWETCTLRKWLNGDFLNAAFSAEEQARLETVAVTADKNPKYDTNPGNDTQDKVFLLSIAEADRYFGSDDARICMPTKTAVSNGAYTGSSGACLWWLRSPGYATDYAAYVDLVGSVNYNGYNVNYVDYVVRPVVVLRLSLPCL